MELSGRTGIITLNNIQKRNALSSVLVNESIEAFSSLRKDNVRAVILRAPRGSAVFSAGHDITELPRRGRDPLAYNDPLEHLLRTIRHFPAPVICLVEGTVWGGACELCFACDIIVCEKSVTFAITPARLGVPYNTTGLLNIRNALGAGLIREMLFTGEPFTASRLHETGLVNYICLPDELDTLAFSLAEKIGKNSPRSISAMKEQLRLLDNAAPLSPETFERLQGLRRSVYDSADYEEGLQAFLEKRAPVFTGN